MNSIQPHVCLYFEQCVPHILFTLRLVSKKMNKTVCDVVKDVSGPNPRYSILRLGPVYFHLTALCKLTSKPKKRKGEIKYDDWWSWCLNCDRFTKEINPINQNYCIECTVRDLCSTCQVKPRYSKYKRCLACGLGKKYFAPPTFVCPNLLET